MTQALSAALRETDLLARLGGDEFMVIVEDFDDPAVLGRIAQKLLRRGRAAVPHRGPRHLRDVVDRHRVYPDDSDDPEELLKHADVAMYRSARSSGRNTYQYLDAEPRASGACAQHSLETVAARRAEARASSRCTTSRCCAWPTAP